MNRQNQPTRKERLIKNYAELDLAITLVGAHDPEEDSILAGIAIPSKFCNAFIHNVKQLAVAKYWGHFRRALGKER